MGDTLDGFDDAAWARTPEGIRGLTDCHAHLGDPVFDADRDEVIARARRNGVERVVVVGETLADARRNLELASASGGFLRPCAGLYPTRLDEEEAAALEELARGRRDELIAIGEVGLDLWKVQDPDDQEVQRRIFTRFVRLADELDLPLNVHSRSAGRQAIELLVDLGARRVQLHAFDGRAAKARPALEAGYYFSVPPSVVRSPQKQKLVRALPLERLLLETDSPVLGPSPAERNQPCNVSYPLHAIAALKDESIAAVAEATRDNVRRLFGE
ncbi:MAG: TatD family deoxyribonuclease [Acidobacteria bacterium]|nr:MAG: TatD family deoxyribonuclease [Acidobacteriota bacterium]REK07303.1 MAG: TatD family deoxyribonuclease [Acidobacteriota bacterium]